MNTAGKRISTMTTDLPCGVREACFGRANAMTAGSRSQQAIQASASAAIPRVHTPA